MELVLNLFLPDWCTEYGIERIRPMAERSQALCNYFIFLINKYIRNFKYFMQLEFETKARTLSNWHVQFKRAHVRSQRA